LIRFLLGKAGEANYIYNFNSLTKPFCQGFGSLTKCDLEVSFKIFLIPNNFQIQNYGIDFQAKLENILTKVPEIGNWLEEFTMKN